MLLLAVRSTSDRTQLDPPVRPVPSASKHTPRLHRDVSAPRTFAAPISPRPAQAAPGNPVQDDTMPISERTHMRALHSPRTHTANTLGTDAAVTRRPARAHDFLSRCRDAVSALLLVVTTLLVGGFLPSAAHAGTISGTVFEDVNYAGGAGRSLSLALGVPIAGARVEIFDGVTGQFKGSTTTGPAGTYSMSQNAGSYIVRVVGRSVASSRAGFSPGLHFAVPTYRVDAHTGVAVGVANEVGGHQPIADDGANAGGGALIDPASFQFILGASGYAQSGAQVSLATGASSVAGVDFGYNFDTVVNTNDAGAGSLAQVLFNASGLSNFGLVQEGFAADTEHAIFMISNGTNAPGLRAANNYFAGGVATILQVATFPLITDPVVIDATTQPGFTNRPIVALNGVGAGVTDGMTILAPGCEVRGLIIGKFDGSAIQVQDADAKITGCWLGVDPTGNGAWANTGDGITVWSNGAVVGGSGPGDANVLSGNGGHGVLVQFTASAATIQGNQIGTNASGSAALPNATQHPAASGLRVDGDNCVIGGTFPGEGNVISGNQGAGAILSGFANRFVGNMVGTSASGIGLLGNGTHGLLVSADFGGSNLAIGGMNAGEGNVFANNGGNGIAAEASAGEGIAILANRIFNNGLLGIDLKNDGVTANDDLDTDSGPNSLQNFPVLAFARTTDTKIQIKGSMSSDPSTAYRLEFFANGSPDASGNGEAERFLGAAIGHTDAFGTGAFDTTLTAPVVPGEWITATATALDFKNTSEFSAAFRSREAAGIIVTPNAGLVTSEAGDSASFSVVLEAPPTANVVIALSSTNPAEGAPVPASLTFNAANWSTPHVVQVHGVDDFRVDGPQAYQIITAPAVSADAHYSGRNAADVALTNNDNDVAGIAVTPTAGLLTTEASGTATFTVKLTSQPDANVAIALASNHPGEGIAAPTGLTFTAADWNVPQTVTVTGVDDFVADGDQAYAVALSPAVSADPHYSGMDPADVSLTNKDDDVVGVAFSATTGLVTTEAGGTATFTVRLTSQPSGDVSFDLSSSDASEGGVEPAGLVFTAANWNVPQTVTVTGEDDVIVDGDQAYSVVTSVASSPDPAYNGYDPADPAVMNTDNDVASIVATPAAGLVTDEAGHSATFDVVLTSQPSADVTFAVASSDASEGTAAPASITFTPADWNVPQTVTVTGVDDLIDDGDIAYDIVLAPATSADAHYNGFDAADVGVKNLDDDAAAIHVTPVAGLVTSEAGGLATFNVVLGSQPTAEVVIPVASSDTTEGTTSAASLTFTAADWNVPQTVTIHGMDDLIDDGDIAYDITLGKPASADPVYAAIDPADVAVTNTDDDAAGIEVTPVSGLTTTEAGGKATFTVVLKSQPTADVFIPMSSSDVTEGTVPISHLTFTAANWNVPHTVQVTGVDDLVDDGDIAYGIVLGKATSADPVYAAIDPADVAVTNIDDDAAAIHVTPTAGLITTEAGGTASFSVVLGSQPTADVVIPVASNDATEGTASVSSLTFTAADWNLPQTVTVHGVDDAVQDGDIAYSIALGHPTSADPIYAAIDPADVAVTNSDDDAAGISVSPLAGLVTSEAGGPATFHVVLNSQPIADVVIPVASSDPTEGSVSASSLTFTAADWNVPQTVTVTGVDDAVQDGDIAYSITLGAAASTDPNYGGVNPADVAVVNNDNDAAGIDVTPSAGLVTSEAGAVASFNIVLRTQPTADVTIPVASSDLTEGTVSPASITFTASDWNVPQAVTITGVEDAVDDGDIAYDIHTGPVASADPLYAAIDPADVAVTNTDDDAVGIEVTPTSALVTSEAGGTASFSIVLKSQPTADVVIPVASTDVSEGTVAVSQLTFTAADWNVAQTVTVTGVDDLVDDGDIAYDITLGKAESTDPLYAAIDPADVALSNTDNDTAAIDVTPTAGLVTSEAGGLATFNVVLKSQPTADVVIPVASSDVTEGTVPVSQLTFTAADWNVPQTVAVTGIDDLVDDGDIAYSITLGAPASADPIYAAIDPADVGLTNTDNDDSGIDVTPVSGLVTSEAGGLATFNVVLRSQPTADVAIPVVSSDPTEGTVSAASLTFTAADWNVPQTVTIHGVDDLVDDGDIAYSIELGKPASADPVYAAIDPADVAVTNTDDDAAGIDVTPTAGLVTSEAGGLASFSVVLKSQPTADVVIPVASTDVTEGTVSAASLTFTAADWNVPQSVTVHGVNDDVQDGDIAYSITLGAPATADPIYAATDPADVAVTNTDDDAIGITVTPVSGLTTTEAGGTATFTVRLTSEPTADVTIPVASSDLTEGTVSASSLTFTAADWNVAQTVTIHGVDDLVDDGDIAYTITLGAAASADPLYHNLDAADVAVTNTDDDAVGITVAPIAGLATGEAGGSASFTVVLNSQPTADVVIPVASSDTTEGTVSTSSLTFTAADWNVPQTVTVHGVDDLVADGAIAYDVVLGAAASGDPLYAGMDPADPAAVNADNDAAGITVTPVAGLQTSEAGGTATFSVVLMSQPTADVHIPVSSSKPAEGVASAASLTFTAANWNVAQTVTVTGVDDNVADGNQAYNIVLGIPASADPIYAAIDPADVAVTNADNDAAGITVTPTAGLVTSEAGGLATFTVALQSEPTADVVIPIASSDPTEGSVSAASLTFTAANWNLPQTVTVTGVDDHVVDGTIAYSITTGAAVSSDAVYSGMDAADVAVTNTDDDTAGIDVSPTAGLSTDESGAKATFTIVLKSQPVADVVIGLASSDTTEGVVAPASVTFDGDNWNVPQTITVTGIDDPIVDGDIAYAVRTAAAVSDDGHYAGMDASDVSLVNHDNKDGNAVVLELVPDRGQIEQGQPVTYRIAVRNRGSMPIDDIRLLHTLPPRFGALKGTLSRNGQTLADLPAGPTQDLVLPHLDALVDKNGNGIADPGEPGYAEFRLQLVPGAGAGPGSYTSSVSATATCATCTVAQPVSVTIQVTENTLFTRSALLGRVFEDKNRDGQQGADEPGLANARVVMDEGTSVTTDAQGMFHIPDLEGGPRVVKIDLAGLGMAASATTDASAVVNIAPGLMASVRFGVYFPRDTVSVGRPGKDGLAISANLPESSIDVSGDVAHASLQLNGTPVSLRTFDPPSDKPVKGIRASVQMGAMELPVDDKGRFAASVPKADGQPFDVAMVDRRGRASLAHVQLPMLQIYAPSGEVVLPYGQQTDDVRLAPHAALGHDAATQVAALGGASGDSPAAWTQVRGRTDPGNAVAVNDNAVKVQGDGSFAAEVALHLGENTINVVARDNDGLTNRASLTVAVADKDEQGAPIMAEQSTPELTLYLPPKGVALQSTTLNLAGHTKPGYMLIVNSDTLHVRMDGSFNHRMTLAEGVNHLQFRVVDEAGRASDVARDIEVRSPKMFLVALADGVVGQSSGAAFLRPGQGESYNEGRIAWNLRGWVAGKYLLTSAFDSQRREMHQLFRDLDDNGRNRLLTNLDPDKLYPVYGDSGFVSNSALDGSRLYVGLQGDAVKASLGNFPIALSDVELAGFRRTLYGAQLKLGSAADDDHALPTGTAISVFGAQAEHVHVHDEIEATGGTLYYLSHAEVTEGSAQVSLVVKDRVTGNVLARVPQRLGMDVVVKEFEGRLMFTRPISSVWDDGSLVGDARLMGNPVNIEVDYETIGRTQEKAAMGGRITQDVGGKLTLGTTVVDDASGAGDYRLRGADFNYTPVKGTRLLGEMARSSGHTGRAFTSANGGLSFDEAAGSDTDAGMAWKMVADADLGQLMNKPGLATVSAYARRVDSGFISEGERSGVAANRAGVRATADIGRYGKLIAKFDHDHKPELAQFGQVNGTDVFGMQWRLDAEKHGAAAEFEQRNTTKFNDFTDQQATAAVRYWIKPMDAVKATVEHQQLLSSGGGQSALALEYKPLSMLALEARASTGEQGGSLRGGATVTMNGRQVYVKEEHSDGGIGAQSRTLFGVQAPLGPMSRAYTEYQWLKDPLGDHALSVTGLEQGWKTTTGMTGSVAAEHGARSGETGDHTTVSGVLAYKSAFPLSGSTRAEVRDQSGGANGRQMLSTTRLQLALPVGFSVLTDVRYSQARNFDQANVPARFLENSIGLAWRAPRTDALQILGKLARQEDRRAAVPGDTLGSSETVLGVASLEATIRVLPGLDWAAKGASRLQEDGRLGLPSALAHSTLWTSRVDYRIVQTPMLLGVEYRMLRQAEVDDNRSGWLQELSFDANKNMRFGVGYNFSRFSGDPLVRTQDTARGWFLRAQSRY
jgi:uncharacterized repeat protein (TIGR01451 family)